jgi:hypothetical protein
VIKAIVGRARPLANDLGRVVEAAKQCTRVKVEDLLATVGRHSRGKHHAKAAPPLAFFVPRLNFLCYKSRLCEEERSAQVIPEGIAREVQYVEVIPPERPA